MLNEIEKKILEVFAERLLVTKTEIVRALNGIGEEIGPYISKLKQLGLISGIESMGTCYVLTQKGQRALRNFSNSKI